MASLRWDDEGWMDHVRPTCQVPRRQLFERTPLLPLDACFLGSSATIVQREPARLHVETANKKQPVKEMIIKNI